MNRSSIVRAAMIGTVVLAAAASAAKPPRVTTEKWVVNFAENQCLASRNYGTADKPLLLILKPSPTGEVMQVSIARKNSNGAALTQPAKMQFDEALPLEASMISFTSTKTKYRVHTVNLDAQGMAAMRQAETLSVSAYGSIDERFVLGNTAPLVTAIDRCVVDLRRHWNVNGVTSGVLQRGASSAAPLASYFSSDDYPAVATRAGDMGKVGVVMLIDEAGKLADCMITNTSSVAALDSQTCAILSERAKFAPALSADGKPAKSAYFSRITWVLPDR